MLLDQYSILNIKFLAIATQNKWSYVELRDCQLWREGWIINLISDIWYEEYILFIFYTFFSYKEPKQTMTYLAIF